MAFKADPTLAAMSRLASIRMRNKGLAASGQQVVPQPGAPTSTPTTFLTNRVNQLAGTARTSAAQIQALQAGRWSAPSRAEIYAQAQNRQAASAARAAAGLENASQFGSILGLSDEELQAKAAAYASGRSYGGGAYQPGMVMQEGTVSYQNGVPGIYIKYRTGAGDSTEWTPLQ